MNLPLLTRDYLSGLIRNLTLDLTPEGRLKMALARRVRYDWWQLALAALAGVVFGVLI